MSALCFMELSRTHRICDLLRDLLPMSAVLGDLVNVYQLCQLVSVMMCLNRHYWFASKVNEANTACGGNTQF